jgi:hypothetical protein
MKTTLEVTRTLSILAIETPFSLHIFVTVALEVVKVVELVIDDVTSIILSKEVLV